MASCEVMGGPVPFSGGTMTSCEVMGGPVPFSQ
jgi:hypothetical protein